MTNTNDSGVGSLRDAITQANAATTTPDAPHNISFNIPGTGVQTIAPATGLPQIVQPIVIDGTTQPGASCGNLVPLDANGAITAAGHTPHNLLVEITAKNMPVATVSNVLSFGGINAGSAGSAVRGLVINGAPVSSTYGIVAYAPNMTIECNYIGTTADGMSSVFRTSGGGIVYNQISDNLIIRNNLISGNGGYGILGYNIDATNFSDNVTIANNLVGVDATGDSRLYNGNDADTSSQNISLRNASNTDVHHNVIAGAKSGSGIVFMTSQNLKIRGNYIGPSLSGTTAFPNYYGIYDGRTSTGTILVGGGTAADRNVISGNTLGYYSVSGAGASALSIKGNYIGCSADCSTAVPNAQHGIHLADYISPVIGGAVPGEGNVVVGNQAYGISIAGGSGASIKGNLIGATPANVVMGNKSGGAIADKFSWGYHRWYGQR